MWTLSPRSCSGNKKNVILSDRRESKDLRTDLTANLSAVRGFFDSADASLRMTKQGFCKLLQKPCFLGKHHKIHEQRVQHAQGDARRHLERRVAHEFL